MTKHQTVYGKDSKHTLESIGLERQKGMLELTHRRNILAAAYRYWCDEINTAKVKKNAKRRKHCQLELRKITEDLAQVKIAMTFDGGIHKKIKSYESFVINQVKNKFTDTEWIEISKAAKREHEDYLSGDSTKEE